MSPRPERPRSVHTAIGGVVLDVDRGRMFSLNASGSAIFQLLERGLTDDEVVSALVKQFDIPDDVARTDLADFRRSLQNHALVTRHESPGPE